MLKREIKYMIVAAVTALAAVSCVNKINDYDAERIISFKALRANSTKSSSTNSPSKTSPSTKTPSNAEEKEAFKVWGYALPQDKNWKDDFKGAKTMLEGENYFHSDGIWKSAEDHLWCSRNERMSFFALSPADANAGFTREEGITVKGFNAGDPLSDNVPRLEFATLTDSRKPTGDVATGIVFRNALCEVEFRAKSVASDDIKLSITRLTLSDVATEGDFHSLPQPIWTPGTRQREVTVFEGNLVLDENEQALGTVLRMIPQKLKPRITLRYNFDSGTGGEIKDIDVEIERNLNWAVGKKRIYSFKVSQNLSLTIDSCITDE